eukprot:7533383-Ditylum_brightwellii.AAC.1
MRATAATDPASFSHGSFASELNNTEVYPASFHYDNLSGMSSITESVPAKCAVQSSLSAEEEEDAFGKENILEEGGSAFGHLSFTPSPVPSISSVPTTAP